MRVIIPPKYRSRLLDELHHDHPGIYRLKALARGILWWPGLDGWIEERLRSCSCCLVVQKSPAGVPLHPWRWPERPWQRIHIDFAEKDKQFFLVVIGSHSKWLEVIPMSSLTSPFTIDALRGLFAVYGIPEEVVSDNGPQLVSAELIDFLKGNRIKHT